MKINIILSLANCYYASQGACNIVAGPLFMLFILNALLILTTHTPRSRERLEFQQSGIAHLPFLSVCLTCKAGLAMRGAGLAADIL
jgi:hypothetical protein